MQNLGANRVYYGQLENRELSKSLSNSRPFCCRLFTDAAYLVILSGKVNNYYVSEAGYVT